MNSCKNKQLKVLHVIQGKHFGGAERVVLTLSKCYSHNNIIPSVLCLSDGLLIKKLNAAGIRNFLIPMKSRRDIPFPLIKTIQLIKKENIDIIHTHTVRSNLIGRLAAFFTGRKCVTHLHSPVSRDFADLRRSRINEFIDSLTRPIASRYITVSEALRKEMIRTGMLRDKIITIHNSLDLDSITLAAKKEARIREEYHIPENAFVIAMVALLRPRKGADLLIKAMGKLLEQFPGVYLLLVGNDDISEEPDYGKKLQEMTCELNIQNNVIFTGFRDDVPSILKECDLTILPSRFGEGLPLVILESMAVGVPVIATSAEGIPEIIKNGVNGFLVKPGDVDSLLNKIIEVLKNNDNLKHIAREARQIIMKEYDGHTQARKVESVYGDVLAC